MAALAAAIITLTAVDAYLLVMRERTTPVNVVEAIERYRTPRPGVLSDLPPSDESHRDTTAPRTSPADTTSPASEADPQALPPRAEAATSSMNRLHNASTASPLRPEPGVYVYATDGHEEVSLLNTRRDYPAETTRTIRHREGCQWSMRITFLEEHEEEHSACSSTTRIEVLASSTSVEWFGRRQDNRFECDPPQRLFARGAAPGATTEFVCREGHRTTFEGAITYLGEEEFSVDGETRRVWRIDVSSTATGEIRGSVELDQLIDQATGHVLWEHRRDELDQDTQAGSVHYSQNVTSALTHLDPRT